MKSGTSMINWANATKKRYTSVVWLSPRFLLRVDIKAIALESSVRGAVSVHSSLLRCIISESFQTPRVLSSRDVQTFLLAKRFFTIECIEITFTTHNFGYSKNIWSKYHGNANDMNLTQSSQYKDCQCVEEHRTSLGLVQFPAPW